MRKPPVVAHDKGNQRLRATELPWQAAAVVLSNISRLCYSAVMKGKTAQRTSAGARPLVPVTTMEENRTIDILHFWNAGRDPETLDF
jgi:hypothetical protein